MALPLDTPSSPRTAPWHVLIVEDDPQTSDFFANSVRRCPQLHLVAQAASVAQACKYLSADTPAIDVLMTDLGLPDGSGLEVIRFAQAQQPACEALVISMFGDEDNVLSSIEAGATGYIHKDSAPDDIAQAVLQLKAGLSPISPMIARRVLAKYRSMAQSNEIKTAPPQLRQPLEATENIAITDAKPVDASQINLSPREQEVLELIARGFSYAEIAKLHHLSVHTVQSHIKNLYGKLTVHNKSEAVYEATRMGLLRPR